MDSASGAEEAGAAAIAEAGVAAVAGPGLPLKGVNTPRVFNCLQSNLGSSSMNTEWMKLHSRNSLHSTIIGKNRNTDWCTHRKHVL